MGQRLQTSISREEINFLILQSPKYECMAAHHSCCVPHKVLIHGAVEIPCWDCKNCDWAHCVFLYKLLRLNIYNWREILKENWKFEHLFQDSLATPSVKEDCGGSVWQWSGLPLNPAFSLKFAQFLCLNMLNGLIRMALWCKLTDTMSEVYPICWYQVKLR